MINIKWKWLMGIYLLLAVSLFILSFLIAKKDATLAVAFMSLAFVINVQSGVYLILSKMDEE